MALLHNFSSTDVIVYTSQAMMLMACSLLIYVSISIANAMSKARARARHYFFWLAVAMLSVMAAFAVPPPPLVVSTLVLLTSWVVFRLRRRFIWDVAHGVTAPGHRGLSTTR